LQAPGGFLFSARYDGEKAVSPVHVRSQRGGLLTVASPWKEGLKAVRAEPGGREGAVLKTTRGHAPNWDNETTWSFETEANAEYWLVGAKA
jgi:hypothetical protein